MVDTEIAELMTAARAAAESVRPVMEVEEGSGGQSQKGTAFILGHEDKRIVVSAKHVVAGPAPKLFGVSPARSLPWPRSYKVLEPAVPGAPDPDVAFALAEVGESADEQLASAIPLTDAVPALNVPVGASFLAVGYPASRAKFRHAQSSHRNQVLFAAVHAAPLSMYDSLSLDPRVFIVATYDRQDRVTVEGQRQVGADPHGMSGGVLFLPGRLAEEDRAGAIQCLVAGVLIEYHPEPANVLVATRIDALLDVLAPSRPPERRLYVAADA